MSTVTFRNRSSELAALESVLDAPGAQLIVVWGRRRVGKTALLREAVKERRHLYLVADTQREDILLEMFAKECASVLGPSGISFRDWEAFFAYVADAAEKEELVLVLDEVGFLHDVNPAFYSILQRHWDARLSRTRLRLVLCGSAVSAMERHLMGYRSPLYGRRTGQLAVMPLSYVDARLFFPRAPEARRIELFAVAGGVPAYLLQLNPSRNAMKNIEERVFTAISYLHREPRFLLLQEVREPATYFSVITAMAAGATRFNDIAQRSGLTATALGKYLGVLQELRLVRRMLPATEAREARRNSRYEIADQFFAFWFRFVAPFAGALEADSMESATAHLRAHWNEHVGRVFEEVCRDVVRHRPGAFGGQFERVGAWWSGEQEIDVAAVDRTRGRLFLAECKWTNKPVSVEVVHALLAKRELVEGRWKEVRLAVFSKSGFTEQCEREAEDLLLIDLDGIRSLCERE